MYTRERLGQTVSPSVSLFSYVSLSLLYLSAHICLALSAHLSLCLCSFVRSLSLFSMTMTIALVHDSDLR